MSTGSEEVTLKHETKKIAVLQICDSLAAGGMERVAVNVANGLPRERYESHLCITRLDGPLTGCVAPDVHRLYLHRKSTLDVLALRRLVSYIKQNRIVIVHAHGPSLFIAAVASLFAPHPGIVWHDHYGAHETEERSAWLRRIPATRLAAVIVVSQALAEWVEKDLRIPKGMVRFVSNFVSEPPDAINVPDLPGEQGCRIVCVANLRPQKDHGTLFVAMKMVLRQRPNAHLILLGSSVDEEYTEKLRKQMSHNDLEGHVSWLGSRSDVPGVLKGCDIGVLSSASEGLPLALIEYGMAGLPAVATRVGQNGEVLDEGRAGIIVPPSSPELLAGAILSLLNSADLRDRLSSQFSQRVREVYGVKRNIEKICELYETIVMGRTSAHARTAPSR